MRLGVWRCFEDFRWVFGHALYLGYLYHFHLVVTSTVALFNVFGIRIFNVGLDLVFGRLDQSYSVDHGPIFSSVFSG